MVVVEVDYLFVKLVYDVNDLLVVLLLIDYVWLFDLNWLFYNIELFEFVNWVFKYLVMEDVVFLRISIVGM